MSGRAIFASERVTLMAVLNVTPDSFSDGGRLSNDGGRVDLDRVVDAASALVEAGAHLLDVGGESTRPGARAVAADVEIERTAPAIAELRARFEVPISIDTRKRAVAEAALDAGAAVINDVSGLRHDPSLADLVAQRSAVLVLGHLRGTPENMQDKPQYDDVMEEVAGELGDSIEVARAAGVAMSQLVVDPGIGFGKRLEDNLQLIANAGWLRNRLGLPLLIGPSRKAFLGMITGDEVGARDVATAAACAVAAFGGADGVRVHEVTGARRAVQVGRAIRQGQRKELT